VIGDPLPWKALWPAPVLIDDTGRRVELTSGEWWLVCAATELDRLHSLADVEAGRDADGRVTWAGLMGPAIGLRPDDAPGDMRVTAILARLEVSDVVWALHPTREQREAQGRQVLEKVRKGGTVSCKKPGSGGLG
jgi:hypothetical protein